MTSSNAPAPVEAPAERPHAADAANLPVGPFPQATQRAPFQLLSAEGSFGVCDVDGVCD